MEGRNISTEDLKELISDLTDGLWDDDNKNWIFQDAQFYLPSKAETTALIAAHQQATAKGGLAAVTTLGEGYDCDDFTRSLYGFAVDYAAKNWHVKHSVCIGMAVGVFGWMDGLHSCNWVFLSDGVLKWIEPQNGAFHDAGECVALTLRNLIA
ncbi:MAG: hypothetical protein ACYC6G_03560 [Desulfobaccales bacterium]